MRRLIMSGLDTALTPLRFLERSLEAHPVREAIIDGPRRFTCRQMADTVQRLSEGLIRRGVSDGDTVAVLAPNSAEALIARDAVPLAGGVLVMLNTRLAPPEIAYILGHRQVKFLFGDAGLLQPVVDAGAASGVEAIVVHPDEDGAPGELNPTDGRVEAYADSTAPAPDTTHGRGVDDE